MLGEVAPRRPVVDAPAKGQTAEATGSDQMHLVLAELAHELSEALTAANGYLHASRHLDSPDELHAAIGKAVDQVRRAGDVVVRLRSVAGGR